MRRKIDINKALWRQRQNFKEKNRAAYQRAMLERAERDVPRNWFDPSCAAGWFSYRDRLRPFEIELDTAREELQMPLPETWTDLLKILDVMTVSDPDFISIRNVIYTERSQYREARV